VPDRAGPRSPGRSGIAAGEPVPADRAGGALPLNLNVLDKMRTPGVMSLRQVLLLAGVPDRGAAPAVDDADQEDRRPAGLLDGFWWRSSTSTG
jgi:hypothetical protein